MFPSPSASSTRNRCGFCRKAFPTPAGVKRHIQHASQCRRAWDAWVATKSSSLRPESPPHHEPLDGDDSDQEMGDLAANDNNARSPTQSAQHPYRVTVEDVPDEGEPMETVWVEDHPKAVDQVIGAGECTFERWRREAEAQGQSPWAPFEEREWQLQRWLAKTTGQNDIEEFLKLDIVGITYLL